MAAKLCVEQVARPNPGYLQFKARAVVVAWWCAAPAVAGCAWSALGHLQASCGQRMVIYGQRRPSGIHFPRVREYQYPLGRSGDKPSNLGRTWKLIHLPREPGDRAGIKRGRYSWMGRAGGRDRDIDSFGLSESHRRLLGPPCGSWTSHGVARSSASVQSAAGYRTSDLKQCRNIAGSQQRQRCHCRNSRHPIPPTTELEPPPSLQARG